MEFDFPAKHQQAGVLQVDLNEEINDLPAHPLHPGHFSKNFLSLKIVQNQRSSLSASVKQNMRIRKNVDQKKNLPDFEGIWFLLKRLAPASCQLDIYKMLDLPWQLRSFEMEPIYPLSFPLYPFIFFDCFLCRSFERKFLKDTIFCG